MITRNPIQAIATFAFVYMRRYRSPYESNLLSFSTSVWSLFIILITTALSPIDIFIASQMKNSNGTFKDWAMNLTTRADIEQGVLYGYYSLYALVFFCIFFVLPFVYFYFEESSEDELENNDRCCNAFKYTFVFVVFALVLLMTGAFVPLQALPATNSTEWEKIKIIFDKFVENKGEDAISMVLSVLSSLGILNLIFYTGFGISTWPIGLIRGQRSARKQYEEIQERQLISQIQINALREREMMGRLNQREMQLMNELESVQRGIQQRETLVGDHRRSFLYKCRYLIRPIEILVGVCGLALSLLIWVSLLLTNVDKALHTTGFKMGFVLSKRTLFNPMDYVLVNLQQVYPLDYILFLVITWFLILCTFSGIRNLGIRICFILMYRLKPKRTVPQGLLLTCAILMLTTLGINILFFCISPEYVTFGNQHYINNTNSTNVSISRSTFTDVQPLQLPSITLSAPDSNHTVIQCNNQADEST